MINVFVKTVYWLYINVYYFNKYFIRMMWFVAEVSESSVWNAAKFGIYLDELHEPCSSTVPDLLKKIYNSLPSHSSVLLNVHSSTSEIYGKWNINGTVSVLQYCVLLYTIVYYYNGLERYEQFLQVGRLYRALILLGLALCLPSASVSSVMLYKYFLLIFLWHSLPFSELSLVGLALDVVD